ncbi:MAG: ATP synthase F1 subunit gamma [Bacteroidales bacterium]|nr:ATP synthase F1 subunit gamma [Bacteroidales bacterium]
MASLREIKDHIGSVRSTLKITSAMKLVSSAKLRKAQQAAEGIRPYTEALAQMLAEVCAQNGGFYAREAEKQGVRAQNGPFYAPTVMPSEAKGSKVAIVAVASNSSLCGAFNVNVVRRVLDEVAALKKDGAEVEVFSVGRKVAEAMRKAGMPSPADYTDLVGRNTFDKSAAFAQNLIDAYNSGRYSRILFIYNHFVSTSTQKVQIEQYLPFSAVPAGVGFPSDTAATLGTLRGRGPSQMGGVEQSETVEEGKLATSREGENEFILEPSREEILATLLPQVMRLRVHTVLLDSIAAEHAARMLAMQTASDNAEDLLGELTLEYNKGRQQKITSEILDLVGGAQQ